MRRVHATMRPIAAAVLTMVVAGCVLKPAPNSQETRSEALGDMDLQTAWRAGLGTQGAVQDNWLASFGDSQLNALVSEALQRNPDLRVAAARVEQANQQLRIAESALKPTIGLSGTGGVKMSDMGSALTGILALASWELDLWGRVRYGVAAADESRIAMVADTEFARQSLAASTAKAWFAATQTLGEQQFAADTVKASEELVRLAEQRQRVGIGTGQDLALAEASLGTQRDRLAQAEFAHQSAVRALELLLGRYPAAELQARPDLPALPEAVPAGLPLQMLERRPDMIAAERRVAAAFNRVGQSKAARLPTLRLTANFGYIDSDILQLKNDYENPSGGVGGKLSAPIYTGGALDADVQFQTAKQREAVAQYAQLALRAIGDVETSLAGERVLRDREQLLSKVVDDQQRALDHAQEQYRIGKSDLRNVDQQRISLYSARSQLLRIRTEQLNQRVTLHLALGGSFAEPIALSSAQP